MKEENEELRGALRIAFDIMADEQWKEHQRQRREWCIIKSRSTKSGLLAG